MIWCGARKNKRGDGHIHVYWTEFYCYTLKSIQFSHPRRAFVLNWHFNKLYEISVIKGSKIAKEVDKPLTKTCEEWEVYIQRFQDAIPRYGKPCPTSKLNIACIYRVEQDTPCKKKEKRMTNARYGTPLYSYPLNKSCFYESFTYRIDHSTLKIICVKIKLIYLERNAKP